MKLKAILAFLLALPVAAQTRIPGSWNFEGGVNTFSDTGAANAYAATLSPALSAYDTRQNWCFLPAHTNTGASTLNLGPGAKAIQKNGGSALTGGEVVVNQMTCLMYDGTEFQLNGGAASGSVTSVGVQLSTMPYFTVSNSPVNSSGNIGIAPTTGQTSHQVLGTCGTATSVALCSLVSGDIPTLNQNSTGYSAGIAGGSVGQVPYQSAANTTAFLAGNTAATDQVLVSHGTGSAAQAPTFSNAPALSMVNMTNPQTWNQNTTGYAAGIAGGTSGSIPYQTAANTTAFLNGTAGYNLYVGTGPVLAQEQYVGAARFPALGGDLTGTNGSLAVTVSGLKSVPFCSGFTPTNGQFYEYTTGGSPNPCVTASTSTGATSFSGISGSTNTTAAMVCGTGCSIGTTGSGTIAATNAGYGLSIVSGNFAANTAVLANWTLVHGGPNYQYSSNGVTAATSVSPNQAITSYTTGQCWDFVSTTANPTSWAIDGLSSPLTLNMGDGSTGVYSGLLPANFPFTSCYDGSTLRLKAFAGLPSGDVLAGDSGGNPKPTSTPTLGASGTLGSVTFGNATSGTVTVAPVTGALGTVTASLPANTGTISELNLAQTWSALQTFGTNMSIGGVAFSGGTQGTDTKVMSAGTVSGTGAALCTDSNGGATTSGCSGGSSALSGITAATGANTVASGNNGAQIWNWAQTTNSQTAFTFGETTAATGTSDLELSVKTLAGSTAIPLSVIDSLTGSQTLSALSITPTWNTSGVVDAALLVNVTNTASGAASKLVDAQIGGTSEFNVDKAGNLTTLGTAAIGTSPPACTGGTAGALCLTEGTPFTNVSGTAGIYPDVTAHEFMAKTNGSSSAGMMERVQPGAIHSTANTGAISTATLCAASAGACNTAGQYHVHWDFMQTGTACSLTGATAGATFLLTWTDTNGTAHSAVSALMQSEGTGAGTPLMSQTFFFQATLAAAYGTGDMNISTNGSVIQYATGYTGCTTGTATYQLDAAVSRLQ